MELLLALALIAIVIVGTVVAVRRDGLGRGPAERSQADWTAGGLPSRAYADLARFR